MVVHDLRNPSEGIHDGLKIVKDLLDQHITDQIDKAIGTFEKIFSEKHRDKSPNHSKRAKFLRFKTISFKSKDSAQ